mgnify:CR=1 FL=1
MTHHFPKLRPCVPVESKHIEQNLQPLERKPPKIVETNNAKIAETHKAQVDVQSLIAQKAAEEAALVRDAAAKANTARESDARDAEAREADAKIAAEDAAQKATEQAASSTSTKSVGISGLFGSVFEGGSSEGDGRPSPSGTNQPATTTSNNMYSYY